MGALANPYVLLAMLAFAGGYELTQKVKGPVKAAVHKVEDSAKAVGRGTKHVLTLGRK